MVYFRKSKKIGPVRLGVNVSRRGLTGSSSVGVKGVRLSSNTRGEVRRTFSGAGFVDTKRLSGGRGQPPAVASPPYDHAGLAAEPNRSLSRAGMTLGIVAWAIALLSFFLLSSLSLVLSLIGLPFAVAGIIREPQGRAMAVAGAALTLAGLLAFP